MADPAQLKASQFIAIARQTPVRLCADLLEAEQHAGTPRAVESGLLPDKDGADAWVWPDGLCLVSGAVWTAIGGKSD